MGRNSGLRNVGPTPRATEDSPFRERRSPVHLQSTQLCSSTSSTLFHHDQSLFPPHLWFNPPDLHSISCPTSSTFSPLRVTSYSFLGYHCIMAATTTADTVPTSSPAGFVPLHDAPHDIIAITRRVSELSSPDPSQDHEVAPPTRHVASRSRLEMIPSPRPLTPSTRVTSNHNIFNPNNLYPNSSGWTVIPPRRPRARTVLPATCSESSTTRSVSTNVNDPKAHPSSRVKAGAADQRKDYREGYEREIRRQERIYRMAVQVKRKMELEVNERNNKRTKASE